MFKKGCAINQRSLLSGADRKKLRRGLEQRFGAGLGEDGLDALLPNKGGELELAKMPSPSRTVIYCLDKVPIVVDTSGKGDIFPTCFGLWRSPSMLPQGVPHGNDAACMHMLQARMSKARELPTPTLTNTLTGTASSVLPATDPVFVKHAYVTTYLVKGAGEGE